MASQNSIEGLVAVLVVVFVIYRQGRWRDLARRRSWRTPVFIGAIGVIMVRDAASRGAGWSATAAALLLTEAVLAFTVGAWMGAVSEFRIHEARWQVRTGMVGSLLWVLLIAAHAGAGVMAHHWEAEVVASGGAAVILVAINRVGRRVTIARRAVPLNGECSRSAAH